VRAAAIRRRWGPLARRGIELVNAPAQFIDLEARQVRAESRLVRYDHLIVALGPEPAPEMAPGLAESAQTFATFEGAERMAAALRYFAAGRVLVVLPPGLIRWPPAAYELAMLMEHHFHTKKLRQKVEIAIASQEQAPLAYLGAQVSDLVAGQLAHKGIEFIGESAFVSIDQAHRLACFEGGAERPFDLLISAAPLKSPAIAVEAGLVDESGWIGVDPATMETSRKGVYAVGSVAAPRRTGALLWSGPVAAAQAGIAARDIARRFGVEPGPSRPQVNGRFFIEVGAGAAFMVSGDFTGPPERLSVTQPSIVWHWAKALAEKRWRYERW
jgi:sulfide:quinone oxidoreductase